MRHDSVSSEITGRGYRYPNVPASMMESQATLVRYETKEGQTGNALCSVMGSNPCDVKAGVSRGHISPTPGVMPRTW